MNSGILNITVICNIIAVKYLNNDDKDKNTTHFHLNYDGNIFVNV